MTFELQFSCSLTIRTHLSLREGLIKASGHHGTFGFHQLSSSVAKAVDAGVTWSSHPLLCLVGHTNTDGESEATAKAPKTYMVETYSLSFSTVALDRGRTQIKQIKSLKYAVETGRDGGVFLNVLF